MPASNIDLYRMQASRNNFDAMRPAPVCADANISNQFMGQCQQNIHISTNCYYGYHDPKTMENKSTDCEMMEVSAPNDVVLFPTNSRKRSAEDTDQHLSKRIKEDLQCKKTNEPETYEIKSLAKNTEELLEILYWNIHGGNIYQISQ